MGQCSICALPEVAAMVDDWLDAGVFLDDISARLALQVPPVLIHRSSIHRHSKKCYSLRQRAARLKERESSRRAGVRIFVQWPQDSLFGELAGKITSDADAIAPSELRGTDVLVSVTVETVNVRNAPALQDAPKEEKTMPQPETPEEEKADGLFARLRKLLTGDKPAEQSAPVEPPPPTVEEIQAACQHDFKPIATGERCQACGLQKDTPAVFGLSRAQFFEGMGRHRRL